MKNKLFNEIRDKLGISCMIVDSNDFGREILRKVKWYYFKWLSLDYKL